MLQTMQSVVACLTQADLRRVLDAQRYGLTIEDFARQQLSPLGLSTHENSYHIGYSRQFLAVLNLLEHETHA